MKLNDAFNHLTIKGKDVYVVKDHHQVLAAWARIRRSLEQAPNLITIDHHTDTDEAFLGYACLQKYQGRVTDEVALRTYLTKRIDWQSDASILQAIEKLRHDEHIDAATQSGVLSHAFCIELSGSGGYQSIEEKTFTIDSQAGGSNMLSNPNATRPLTYIARKNQIYVIPSECYIGCREKPHNDNCVVQHANEIIESRYLEDQLSKGAEISACIGLAHLEEEPYIFDIDLDAFHSRQAINPDDASTVHRLIKNAVAITIAREDQCVADLWQDEHDQMNSTDLLAELMRHIAEAL